MVRIKPFRGIRPPKQYASEVASRPYDVLNSAEAKAEATERSLLHIIKPEIDFDPIADEHSQEVYEKAMENFRLWREKGWLQQDDQEHYYIYAQTMEGSTQYGLAMCCHFEDYLSGAIKKHELTRPDKEEDRMIHVRSGGTHCSEIRIGGVAGGCPRSYFPGFCMDGFRSGICRRGRGDGGTPHRGIRNGASRP